MHLRVFKQIHPGTTALLILLTLSISASAAVSQGPKCTNAVVAEQQRNTEFYRAEQSYQEKLKVGRERYDQKQMNRAKIIAAMSAELQARQQTVVIQPGAAPDANTGQPAWRFRPSLDVVVLAVGLIAFGCYLHRLKPASSAPLAAGRTPFVRYTLD